MVVSAEVIYEAFRKFLASRLRVVDDDTVHVGEVVGCLRKAFYSRRYGDRDLRHLTPSKRVVLSLGMSAHLVLEEVLREAGYRTEEQVIKEFNGFKLAGTPDAVNGEHVLEIKTVSKIPDEPYPHHVMQLNTYLGMLGYSTGYIIYINRRDGQVSVVPHNFNEVMYREVVRRAEALHKHLKDGTLPEAEPSYLCNYCEWRWRCLRNEP